MTRNNFRQTEITRAIMGAKAAGMDIERIEIAPDGTISVVARDPRQPQVLAGAQEAPEDTWADFLQGYKTQAASRIAGGAGAKLGKA